MAPTRRLRVASGGRWQSSFGLTLLGYSGFRIVLLTRLPDISDKELAVAYECSSSVTAAGQRRFHTGLPREEPTQSSDWAVAKQATCVKQRLFLFTPTLCHGPAY